MIREIIENSGALRERSVKVTTFDVELRRLIDDLWETMAANDGRGLAAPQVGEMRRVLVAEHQGRRVELVNPSILKYAGPALSGEESCLSLPGVVCLVARPTRVLMQGRDRHGKSIQVSAVGELARTLQHEFDHLQGVLITDRGPVVRMESTQPQAAWRMEHAEATA